MNPFIQLHRQLRYLSITLLLACFAIAQNAQAGSPEANEDSPNVNAAEEDSAVVDLGSVTGNAGPTATPVNKYTPVEVKPNKWEIRMDFTRHVMCAMEPVRFPGELHISFANTSGSPLPNSVTLVGQVPGKPFLGLGTSEKPLGRKYVLQNKIGQTVRGHPDNIHSVNGLGDGTFRRDFKFVAKSNLPGEDVEFTLKFVLPYDFKDGKVIRLEDRRPEIIKCIP